MTKPGTNWRERISARPDVLGGKPVIDGTRIGVEFVLEMFANGVSAGEILDEYPRLTQDDLDACLAYAAELVSSERQFPLSA